MNRKIQAKGIGKYAASFPFFILVIFFLLAPLSNMVWQSFISPETGSLSVANYIDVFSKPIYQAAMRNSLYLTLLSTVAGLIVSFIAAMAAAEATRGWNSKFLSILNMVSNFAGLPLAFAFIILIGNSGVLIEVLNQFGIHALDDFNLYGKEGLLLVFVYFQIPLGTLVLLPSFQSIRKEWKESAALMKASPFRFWWNIGIPVMLPSLCDTFSMLFANALTAYATPYMMISTNYPLLPIKITSMFTGETVQQQEMGSALSITMMLIMLLVIFLCNMVKKFFYKGGNS
ncbi:ABC transporter permease [Agathobaculum sp. LCP25S3_E8]|uniref:ABC transporter permease n=1 Tax=Agathobaculum sp. LCP25S3_E8 TaxID=3438735 RepID=UPI003F926DE4